MSARNPLNAYKETHIKTASPGKLIILLYEEALRQLDEAVKLLEEGVKQLDLVNNSILRAQDMITELMVSLDFEKGADIAGNLFSLYMYFNQQLTQANIKKDIKPVKQVRKLMGELCDAWKQAVVNVGQDAPPESNGNGINIAG